MDVVVLSTKGSVHAVKGLNHMGGSPRWLMTGGRAMAIQSSQEKYKRYTTRIPVGEDPKVRPYVQSLVNNARLNKPSGFDITNEQIIGLMKKQRYL